MFVYILCLFFLGISVAPPVFRDTNITSRVRTYDLCVLSSPEHKMLVQDAFNQINELSLFRLVLDTKRKQNSNNHICFSPNYLRPGKTFVLPNHISITYILSTLPPNVLQSVILHELLHTLGLADVPQSSHESSVMALRVYQNPTSLAILEMTHAMYLSPSDVDALQLTYDMQTWAQNNKYQNKCYLSNPFLTAPALLQNISFPSREITFVGCETMLSEEEQLVQHVLEEINQLGFFQLFYQAKNANKTICFSSEWTHRTYGFVASLLPPNVKYTETLRTILVLLGFWPFPNTTTESSIMNFEIPSDLSEITYPLWMSVADIKALSKLYYSQAWASAEPRKCE